MLKKHMFTGSFVWMGIALFTIGMIGTGIDTGTSPFLTFVAVGCVAFSKGATLNEIAHHAKSSES
jgi:hypothetical protein